MNKTILALGLSAVLGSAAWAAPAPVQKCAAADVQGSWQIYSFQEQVPGDATAYARKYPYRYILFMPNGTFFNFSATKLPDAKIFGWGRSHPVGSYALRDSGNDRLLLLSFSDGRREDLKCSRFIAAQGSVKAGDVVLQGYNMQNPSRQKSMTTQYLRKVNK